MIHMKYYHLINILKLEQNLKMSSAALSCWSFIIQGKNGGMLYNKCIIEFINPLPYGDTF